ncbi:nuclear factor of activated T-cells, cytoplasmic 2 isoform X2 [Amia ocellicauda]|uniref:nuclear factor of activated T-cells, cytoplasmic 2 isoform X2 n=1 Tax=Amia ocellicauda TaxID=2972642 RepID=UPI0034645395
MTSMYEDKDPNNLGIPEEINQVNCSDELDFSILFEYEPPCSDYISAGQDEPDLSSHKPLSPPSGVAYPHEEVSPYSIKSCNPSPYPELPQEPLGGYGHLENKNYLDHNRVGPPSALSPRIEITPSHELLQHSRESLQGYLLNTCPRFTLPVPGHENVAYREPLCLSPASSNSSTSWHSETNYSPWASPCVSPNNGQTTEDLCPRFQNIHATNSPRTSPSTSPRASITEDSCLGPRSPSPRPGSRSASPQGKRTYDEYKSQNLSAAQPRSRTSSPLNFSEDIPCPANLEDAMNGLSTGGMASIPPKITKINQPVYPFYTPDNNLEAYTVYREQDVKRKPGSEPVFLVPPNWTKPLVPGIPISIPVSSLPSLEWPIPSRTEQYELEIEVQPKPHHRAHYETEGSRGAVKAPTGGHPVVQLHGYRGKEPLGLQIFIGTADERILKPHAFYQVHRITGKTVTTTSYEKVVGSTKILEIPLEPKNNMKAVIDCAGILKLRNADIELRKGETDIGRKNTRVRLVFRIHIPQPGGGVVSLQAASNPIECSQRSAHELPMVEKQDTESCSILGGQQMILTGQNFTSDSKVVFTEKTHDGQQIWEMEATVDKDKSQPNMLFVEVPPYRDPSICHPAKVNFYVINGKRKRSQPQHFTYTPLAGLPVSVPAIKTEPDDDYEATQIGYQVTQILGSSPQSYYHPRGMINTDGCLLPGMAPCQQARPGLSAPDSRFQQQSPAIVYPRSKNLSSGQVLYPQVALMGTPGGIIPDTHRSVLVHKGSPVQPAMIHHQSASPNQHSSSIIQFSPTNHQLRGGAIQDHQHIMYCENYGARSPTPPVAHPQQVSPSHYPTVIQQQPYVHKMPKSRSPPSQVDPQRCPPNDQRENQPGRVTVKQENLDQAYLDDAFSGYLDEIWATHS